MESATQTTDPTELSDIKLETEADRSGLNDNESLNKTKHCLVDKKSDVSTVEKI